MESDGEQTGPSGAKCRRKTLFTAKEIKDQFQYFSELDCGNDEDYPDSDLESISDNESLDLDDNVELDLDLDRLGPRDLETDEGGQRSTCIWGHTLKMKGRINNFSQISQYLMIQVVAQEPFLLKQQRQLILLTNFRYKVIGNYIPCTEIIEIMLGRPEWRSFKL
ncbi:telo2-interacting protein 1 [Plakobranchus ocellatus]|uniref:Telo2-interacting protein 1 n=1 Tax=Plakobranchus ocellatus TaxID=259542 RepID=A0AAV4BT16_9GAST|nr:telo2-interacting protein 1 [Plakobranchus ocellatus]